MLNTKRLAILRRLVLLGYEDEKAIKDISSEDLLEMCKSIQEARDIVALQKAINNNSLLSYLTGK